MQPGKRSAGSALPRLAEEPRAQVAHLIHSNYRQLLGKCCANACSAFSLLFMAGFISEAKLIPFIALNDFSKACSQLELLDINPPRHPYPKQTTKLWPSPGSAHAESCLPTQSGEISPGRDVCGGRTGCSAPAPLGLPHSGSVDVAGGMEGHWSSGRKLRLLDLHWSLPLGKETI